MPKRDDHDEQRRPENEKRRTPEKEKNNPIPDDATKGKRRERDISDLQHPKITTPDRISYTQSGRELTVNPPWTDQAPG